MKVTKDLIKYLEHLDTLSKPLSKDQRAQLEGILSTILSLLVHLKRSSNLGKTVFPWEK